MSDPMSNVEIEDVLSSIRRLVSENAARPRPGAAPGADALVLTPSLRVERPEAEGEALAEAPSDAGASEREAPSGEAAGEEATAEEAAEEERADSLHEAVAEVIAAGQDTPETTDSAERALDASWEEVASPNAPPETFEFAQEAEAELRIGAGSGAPDDALQSRVAGLEAAFDAGDDYEPDGSEVAENEENFDWDEEGGEDTVIDLSTPDVPVGRLHFTRESETLSEAEVIELGEADAADVAETRAEDLPEDLPGDLPGDMGDDLAGEPASQMPEDFPEMAAEAEESWPEPEEDWTAPELPRPDDAAEALPVETAAEPGEEPGAPLLFRAARRTPLAEPAAAPELDPKPEPDPEPPLDTIVADLPPAEAAWPEAHGAEADEEPDALAATEAEETVAADFFEEADEDEADALEGYVVGTEHRAPAGRLADEDDPWEEAAEDATPEGAALAAAGLHAADGRALIDEDRLADLVAEVVRAELRGRMGERITQNVRKLVRREIARALETRGIR